jgi:hypothetical protein
MLVSIPNFLRNLPFRFLPSGGFSVIFIARIVLAVLRLTARATAQACNGSMKWFHGDIPKLVPSLRLSRLAATFAPGF